MSRLMANEAVVGLLVLSLYNERAVDAGLIRPGVSDANLFLLDHSGRWWGPCLDALTFLVGTLPREGGANDQVAESLVGDGRVPGIGEQACVEVAGNAGEEDVLAFLLGKLCACC